MDHNDYDYDDYDIYDYDDYDNYDDDGNDEDEQPPSAPPTPRPTKKRTRIRWGSVAVAAMILILIILLIYLIVNFKNEKENEHGASSLGTSDTSRGDDIPAGAQTTINGDTSSPDESESEVDSSSAPEPVLPYPVKADITVADGVTYMNGIVIINKTYSVPESYDPGVDPVAFTKLEEMYAAAADDGLTLWTASGYRTYDYQRQLYEDYAARDGYEAADRYSARPGHSEHESGFTFDVNDPSDNFNGTEEAIWLEQHCAEYGFIIRYPLGKEDITGFKYESWHVRYVGEDIAKVIMENGICLEEYFGITSQYSGEYNG